MAFMPIVALSALLHLYIGWRLVPDWGHEPVVQVLIGALLLASAVLMMSDSPGDIA